MNRYGAMAKHHWMEWMPSRYRRLENPDEYFDQLGADAQHELETLVEAMLTTEPADLPDKDREGWRAMARLNAEEQIVREMILIAPDEPEATEPEISALGRDEMLRALFEAEERAGLTEPFESSPPD
jgi:hypothetical protein